MRLWGKIAAAIAAPLLLTGCLWGPGKFNSDLALRKGGTFTLNYRGEIMLQLPDDKAAPERWHDEMAVCFADGSAKVEGNIVSVSIEPPNRVARDVDGDKRRCTAAEVAKLKAEYQKKTADRLHEQRQEADNMAKLFGLPGADDESNRRFAANLMKYRGWRSVTYKGKGVFDVDYHFEGRTDQDFAFPMMPDSDLIIPFIMIRRRADGAVMVTAPALTGGHGPFSARAKMMGLPDKGDGPPSRAEGRFTITTDGEILTNNSEDGPVATPAGRKLQWTVDAASRKVPEMLLRL